MRPTQIILYLCALAGVAYGLDSTKSACENLCANCGGTGLIRDSVCECRLPADQTVDCLKKGMTSEGFLDTDWNNGIGDETRIKRSIPPPRKSINRLRSNERKRRLPRESVNIAGFAPTPDTDYDAYEMFRNYRSPNGGQNYEKSHVYEVYIGDDDEESLQLVFPDSNGLEVEHQYLFRDEQGEEHPCSGPVQEPQLREKELDFEDTWSSPYYQPRGRWNSQGAEDLKTGWGNGVNSGRMASRTSKAWDYRTQTRQYDQPPAWGAQYYNRR